MFSMQIENGLKKSIGRWFTSSVVKPILTLDGLQETALKEKCILVDENDKNIGHATKKECHLVQPDGHIPLHRAFSVFMFNSRGDLLLQKRSPVKITFPDCYTNTCCSHPIDDVPGENEDLDAIGVKRAARRRMNYELGIAIDDMPLEKFKYLTRIHYFDNGDGQWGEHEIDYILFLLADVKVKPNPNEISEISYIPSDHMSTFVPTLEAPLTPWFNLIYKHRLRLWWKNLNYLDNYVDHKTIYKLS